MIEITETNPMQKEMNKHLMVRWINADLINRANCDVRKSFCYYDEDKDFVFATVHELHDESKARVEEATKGKVRYWSKGIV